jgi:asparaginyl-tRNA synthetase
MEIHAPVITFSDCEGAGEMFSLNKSSEFFGAEAHLTVSAQLHAEMASASAPRVYTFGPIFRAEKHDTVRHMSEFWMLEPEISFVDNLDVLMNIIERLLGQVSFKLLESRSTDLATIHSKQDASSDDLLKRIDDLTRPYERMSYDEAIKVLGNRAHEFKQIPKWGASLQLEHEKYLAEKIVGRPCFVTDYPSSMKSFYMRRNDDGKTVACCDLLVPGLAEIVGGSLREDRVDVLRNRIRELGMSEEGYQWYLDLRRFGGSPHGGFGLGFDRFLQYITGIHNIRDVSMIPRTRDNHKY